MVLFRISSVFYYLGLTVLCLFLSSHPISHRRCVVVMRPLPGLSGLAHIVRLVRRYHTLSVLVFRFLPASLRHHHLHLPLRCRFPLIFYFGRSSNFRLKCREVFRPICRIYHQDPGHSVCFWDWFRRWCWSFRVFLSVWNNGPEINFRLIIFAVSVFTVFSVPPIAVCILFWNLYSRDFLL